jgi:hypothetical protein
MAVRKPMFSPLAWIELILITTLKKYMKAIMIIYAGLLLLTACSSEPKDAIVKKWRFVEVKCHSDMHFHNTSDKVSLEFTKEGKFNTYDKDMLESSLTYVMATDGKSFLISHPAGTETIPVEIIRLDADDLVIKSKLSHNDTMILKTE